MYHTEKINQVQNKKSFNLEAFLSKQTLTDHFNGDIERYLGTCTPFQKQVAHYILKYRYASTKVLTNECIATAIGCSIKTVTRSTNKFLKDGFITKHQPSTYSPNYYSFNDKIKKGSHAFSYWFNSLSSTNQDLYMQHGVRTHNGTVMFSYRNVPPKDSSLILESLFTRSCPLPRRVRVKIAPNYRKTREKKGMKVNSVQKQLILTHRDDPRVKEVLNNPKIKGEIITPDIEKLTQLLSLSEPEQFKLIAFDEKTISHLLALVEPIVMGTKMLRETINNKMAWLLSLANTHAERYDLKPDWKWYYDMCNIMGIDTYTGESKPLVVRNAPKQEKKRTPEKGRRISPWEVMLYQLPLEARVEKWKKEVVALQNMLPHLGDPDPFNLKGLLLRNIENAQHELAEAEKELRSNNEKQILLHQHTSSSMAPCSA